MKYQYLQLERRGSLVHLILMMFFLALIVACTPTTQNEAQLPTDVPDVTEPEETDDVATPETDESEVTQPEIKTLFVGSEQVDCVGFVPQSCLLVKEDPNAEYEYFYDAIEGFEWEAGFEYEIQVAITENENPPADGSSLAYQLIEILAKTAVAQPEINGIRWILLNTVVGGDAVVPAPDWSHVFFKIEDGLIFGNSGCNQFNGSVTLNGANLSVGPMATTRKLCSEDTMMLEQTVLSLFEDTPSFSVENDLMTLYKEGLPVATFIAAEEMTLFVGPEQVECQGEGLQYCLLVKESPEAEYSLFYDYIQFFDWEPGFEYELLVAVTKVLEPLADGSSLRYTLIEVVNETLVSTDTVGAEALFGQVWQWIRFDSPSDLHNIEVSQPEKYTIQFFEDGTYQIQNDCNVGNGRYTANSSSIAFEPALTTLAACGDASLDMQFIRNLQDVATYVLSEGTLYLNLKYDSGNVVMEAQP